MKNETPEPSIQDHFAEQSEPDYTKKCTVCDQKPILPVTGMCGPCTFGEAETAGGNW